MPNSSVPAKRPAPDAQEKAWVADEDRFVLQQAKRKAAIRVKAGRAEPIDWLVVTLTAVDPERNVLNDTFGEEQEELELRNPEDVLEDLTGIQLKELESSIETYVALEQSKSNLEYWTTMKTICQERRKQSSTSQTSARGVNSVSDDLDKLLGSKTLEELEKLEKQIRTKLVSDEAIDTDYWDHLLSSLLVYKAKAKLRKVSQGILHVKLGGLRKQQAENASALRARFNSKLSSPFQNTLSGSQSQGLDSSLDQSRHPLDPEPLLRLALDDKKLPSVDEQDFLHTLTSDRRRVLKVGYLSKRKLSYSEPVPSKRLRADNDTETVGSSAASFDREVARGVAENEEVFNTEESVATKNLQSWSGKYRPRKPKHFNRVQTGYEWNKYNQTHYDHDNPPPKVIQGYKFNIFYPDLIDKTKAPTYRIEREGGRRRGQSFVPAGQEDTCLIRFIAGPPYEDIAFRIVDKEWDYSAKRERGFRSSFDNGILQLHFQFKKIYYRK